MLSEPYIDNYQYKVQKANTKFVFFEIFFFYYTTRKKNFHYYDFLRYRNALLGVAWDKT